MGSEYAASTNRRIADERLPCVRSASMDETRSDNVSSRCLASSRRAFQNVSSRLILVLCPATTVERFSTVVFCIAFLHYQIRHLSTQVRWYFVFTVANALIVHMEPFEIVPSSCYRFSNT